jgi:hypothetical protein
MPLPWRGPCAWSLGLYVVPTSLTAAYCAGLTLPIPLPRPRPQEKYRPKNVGDISSQEDIVRSLRNAVSTGNIPHMLFYGPPGTGKTSTILAMCRDLYGCVGPFRARAICLCAVPLRPPPPPHPSPPPPSLSPNPLVPSS